MQSSEKQGYKWLQGSSKVEPVPMRTSGGGYTVDRSEQLEAILNEWTPIFHKFKDSKPDVATFMEHFGVSIFNLLLCL